MRSAALKCIFHLSQSIQKWARKHGLANFYANSELKEWIILSSKLVYLLAQDVLVGFASLITEYEGLLMQIAKQSDGENVSPFLHYVRKNYIYQGSLSNPKAARSSFNEWNINEHILLQRRVSNNAVKSWNRQYKGLFFGGGKPDRSKVIQHHVDEEESVRHAVIRQEDRPEEQFRQVRPRQLESEEQVHGLVSTWNERRGHETEVAKHTSVEEKNHIEIYVNWNEEKDENASLDVALPVIASFLDELDETNKEKEGLPFDFGVDAPLILKAVQLKEWSVPDFAAAEQLLFKAFLVKGAAGNMTEQLRTVEQIRYETQAYNLLIGKDIKKPQEPSVKRGRGRPKKSTSRESVEDPPKQSKSQPFF